MSQSNAWDTLLNYESHDLVERSYAARHGRSPKATHVKEISACFIQGREYFSRAATSDRVVKPLLLFYGVMSLSRGAILFLSPDKREDTLNPKHGLSEKGWRHVFRGTNPDLGELTVVINKTGTLAEFGAATRFRSLLRHYRSTVMAAYAHKPIDQEYQVTLGDIVSRLPELRSHYVRWTPKLNSCTFLEGGAPPSDKVIIQIPKHQEGVVMSEDTIHSIFWSCQHRIVEGSSDPNIFLVETPNEADTTPIHWDRIDDILSGIGRVHLVARFRSGYDLSKPLATYVLAYFLGMLVRYFPSQWLSLVRNERGDVSLPTLMKSVSYIEQQFPQMILDFLEEEPLPPARST